MIKMLKIDNITKTFYKGTEEENRVFENFPKIGRKFLYDNFRR